MILDIGTHDIQNITVSSNGPGGIGVTGDFIDGSSAIGILIIAYSSDSNVYYQFISRSDLPMSDMSGLSGGLYKVSIFVMDDSGLPFSKSATVPRNVTICKGKH